MKNKIKCLFLSENYAPTIGGSCTLYEGRFKYLSESDVHVLTKYVENSKEYDERLHYRIKRIECKPFKQLRGFEWLGISFSFFINGLNLIMKYKFQYIECARSIPEGIAGTLLALLFRKKLVINCCGEDISVLMNYKIEKMLIKLVFKFSSLIIPISSHTENLVFKLNTEKKKIKIIYPGFNPSRLQNTPAPIEGMPDRKLFSPILLTIGRYQQRKGQDRVIQALPLIKCKFPDVQYITAGSLNGGDTSLFKHLEQLATDNNVQSNVKFLKEVSNNEITFLYNYCDIFIMPNRVDENGDVEGYGIVFIEAGYFGKPAIGGSCGGSTDAIQDGLTGFLVDGNSPVDIAEKIIKLYSDKKLSEKMGAAGKEYAQKVTDKEMSKLYRRTLADLFI